MTLREVTFIGSFAYTPDLQISLQNFSSGVLGGLNWFEQGPLGLGVEACYELNEG